MVPTTKIIVWGAGGHAMVVADILNVAGGHEIVGFVDDSDPRRHGQAFSGATVVGGREQLPRLRAQGVSHVIFGFGDNSARLRLGALVKEQGFALATAIHPSSVVARGVTVGAGSVIAAGAILNPGVRVGENVIVNTAASVDHECIIEDGVHVSPGAHLGGACHVGRGAWIAIGATVVPRIRIGESSIVGAGAVVLDDVPPGVIVYGVPARVQRKVGE
jgi:UDP-N-acetylbacillosamine N-acetyltransferase